MSKISPAFFVGACRADALILSDPVRRRRQQRLRPEIVRIPAACRRAFVHEHIFDASKAPRGQLPYIVDGADTVGDSETILAYVTHKYRLTIDAGLTSARRTTNLLVTRMLDDLYWVMSYSRWQDQRFWPLFRDALMRAA